MKRIMPLLTLFLLAAAQVGYLAAIFFEKKHNFRIIIFIFVILILTGYAYFNSEAVRRKKKHQKYFEHPFSIIYVTIGAALTYYLNINLQFGPVMASASAGMLGWAFSFINKNNSFLKCAPTAVYCGSFVGMCSTDVACSMIFILLAGFLAGLIFFISKPVLQGTGGKLGTIAFAGVAAVSALHLLHM